MLLILFIELYPLQVLQYQDATRIHWLDRPWRGRRSSISSHVKSDPASDYEK
jgi:hypothetical protein